MNWDHPHVLARRAFAASVFVGGVFLVLGGAFFRLQVLGWDQYALQSRNNRFRPVAVPAPRGIIVDRHGVVLATNMPSYTISLLASSDAAVQATLDSMTRYTAFDSSLNAGVLWRYDRSPDNPVVIMRDAPFEVVAALEERKSSFPGLIVQTEPKRQYPHADIVSHLLGYVGEVSEDELATGQFARARMGTLVGRGGLESRYDDDLRGLDGERLVEVDALGRMVKDEGGGRLEPRQGDTLHTSLDFDLQQYVAELFPAFGERGAVIAMDPRNGAILAMYSAPSYDPNEFIGGVDPELWETWLASESTPLLNRAIQGLYPPASPWKLALALMGLERGAVDLDTKMPVQCAGGYQYFNRYFRCWRASGHGGLTLAEAIQHSCDVYFYQLGLMLGLDSTLVDAAQIGFARKTGIDLPGEVAPLFPETTAYLDSLYGPQGWTNAVALNMAIGQGENSQTLIGMMRFYAMLARDDGNAPTPMLVPLEDGAADFPVVASSANVAQLRPPLEMVVASGTAVASRIRNLRIAGKTGTAQNPHGPDHGWFIGFAPVDAPEVVVGAIVEFGEHGSSVAPMVTRIIARHLLGPDADRDRPVRWVLPADSAPTPVQLEPDSSRQGGPGR
jgi:penicillin-binding protein 2